MQEISTHTNPAELCQRRIKLELLKAIYRQLPVIMVMAPIGAVMFALLQSDFVSRIDLILWLLGVCALNGLGSGWLYLNFRRNGTRLEQTNRLHRFLVVFAACVGLIWGLAGVLFLSVESHEQGLLTFVWLWALAAMISAATVPLARVFHWLVYPILIPLAVRTVLVGDGFYVAMGVTTIVYLLGLVFLYRINHRAFVEAVTLHFQNIDLIHQLKQQKEDAEQANKAKSQFLAAASHDLRQPVHAQGLYIAELDEYVDHPRGRRILAGLESSIDALRRMFDAVLDIAKLDAGVVTPQKQDFPLATLLDEIRSETMPQSREDGIDLRFVLSRLTVRSDRVLLGRILRNFVTNALRYTPTGRVVVGCRRRSGHAHIEVWDTGIGIDVSQLDTIFNEFYQIGNPERDRDKGLGLGLAIARRISRLLGHEVSVRSTPNRGSMFSVAVPLATAIAPMLDAPSEDFDLTGVNVVLIEDETQIADAMQGLLTRWGCRVLNATNADAAITRLAHWPHQADVILADYRLAGQDTGALAIQRLREFLERHVPAIVVTGDTAPVRIQEAFLHGDPVFHKPVRPEFLRLGIARACGRDLGGESRHI